MSRLGMWLVRRLNGGNPPLLPPDNPNEYVPIPDIRTTVGHQQILTMAGIGFEVIHIAGNPKLDFGPIGDVVHVRRSRLDEAVEAIRAFELVPKA